MFTSLRSRLEKRARYNRTLAELRAMPRDVAADLDFAPDDFPRIARTAVYGA